MEYKIKADYLTKEYDLYKRKSDKLKSLFSRKNIESFWALKGVSFEVYPGEAVGVIGMNGSGKSTLSNILSGIIPQTSGFLDIRGETSIIAIGAGLKGPLTGLENIKLKCTMSGMTNKEIKKATPEIIEFADLGDFINQPVKSYSSGMKSRLGFAIAIQQNPDILIIDEALAVGDDTFYQKCVDKITEFKKEGKTIIFVSHSLGQVEKLCDRCIWMSYGEIRASGESKEVVKKYRNFSNSFKKLSKSEKSEFQKKEKEKQKSFSLTQLREEVLTEEDNNQLVLRSEKRRIEEETSVLAIGDRMTGKTKLLVTVLTVLLLFLSIVSFNENAISSIFKHPISFVTEQIIELKDYLANVTKDDSKASEKQVDNSSKVEESSQASSSSQNTEESESNSTSEPTVEHASPNTSYKMIDEYTIQEGDTFESIASLYQIPVSELLAANNLSNQAQPNLGEVLSIPWLVGN